MTDVNEWDLYWALVHRQDPLTLHGETVLGSAPGVLAQVDRVLLFSAGVTLDVSLKVSAERLRQVNVSSIDMSESLWVDTSDVDVQVNASVDGSPLKRFHANQDWSIAPGLHATGGEWGMDGSGAYAKSPWWINTIPARELCLHLSWPRLDFEGRLTLDAADWRGRARSVI